MRDEQEREAPFAHGAQGGEQLVHLLRDQHRGGLVEDDDPRAPVQDLEDLHPLPVGHAEPLDQHVRAQLETGLLGEFEDPPPGLRADAVLGFRAEHDVLQHGEVVGEHEVLVHHADADPDRLGRGPEPDFLAVHPNRAGVRGLHSIENLHQGGLAGTVLTAERVHLADAHREVHIGVGDHAGEGLDDAGQLDGRGPGCAGWAAGIRLGGGVHGAPWDVDSGSEPDGPSAMNDFGPNVRILARTCNQIGCKGAPSTAGRGSPFEVTVCQRP